MKRKLLFILSLMLLLSALTVPALALVDLNDPQYVVDDANVLSDKAEQQILDMNGVIMERCEGAQFVVITVPYAPDGMDHEEYANEIFNTWYIGDRDWNNGMLLVVYTEDDDFWLEVGAGFWSDDTLYEIGELVGDDSDFYRCLLRDQDEKAVTLLTGELLDWYEENYASAIGSGYSSDGTLRLLLILLILIIVTSPFRCRRRWGRWGIWPLFYFTSWWRTRSRMNRSSPFGTGGPYMGGGGFGSSYRGRSGSFGGRSGGFGGHSGGFGGGGGFHGGGGHSGGGFGHR